PRCAHAGTPENTLGTPDFEDHRGVSGFYDPAIRSFSPSKAYRAVAKRRVAYAAMRPRRNT
ncbi:MAG TPA: hypothetical protein PLO75_09625, partial [Thermotogota bacterium]|nr:hypothetical protein [Thermotogota bacterium]